MLNENTPTQIAARWLYLFIFLHVFVWTLVPILVRYTLPMDALEGTIWGHQLEWGYDKNPFMNAWLTAFAIQFGQSGWAIYLFSQLSVALCFWATWKLATKILSPFYALLAVLLLEGVQYYNVHAIDFNDNTLELSLWALTALFFYDALKTQTWRNWLLTGLFAGLGMMTKYYTVMLLIPMALFLILHPDNRKSFRQPGFYLGLSVFLLIMLPHIVWLFSHDFVTVHYALDRVNLRRPTWWKHWIHFTRFTWEQIQAFLPPVVLMLLLSLVKKPYFEKPRAALTTFNKQFLFYIGFGPFLLTALLPIIGGMALRAGWGEPLLSLWGIALVAWIQPTITVPRLHRFFVFFFTLMGITAFSYGLALVRADAPSSANFPGARIAKTLTDQWRREFHAPLTYVAGSRWLAGNISFYSPDHPAVYINWDKKVSPWIKEAELQKQGAIFVWDTTEKNEKKPPEVIARFAKLRPMKIMHFTWLRNKTMPPVEIAIAFLPPATSPFEKGGPRGIYINPS